MTADIELLTAQVEQHPHNELVAGMLADALQEYGQTHTEALKHVAHVRAVAVQARELRQATHLVRPDTATGRMLLRDACAQVGLPAGTAVTVLVSTGDAPPALTYAAPDWRVLRYSRAWVTVGAAWVIQRHAALAAHRREVRRRPSRETK